MKKNDETNSSFAPFAKILLKGGDFFQVLQVIKDGSDLDCGFKTDRGELFMASQDPQFSEQLKTFPHRELLRIYLNRPVFHDESHAGTFFLNLDPEELPPGQILENGPLALQLLMDRRYSELKIERRYRENCVQDLIFSRIHHPDELANRASLFGWDLSGPVTAVVAMAVDLDPEDKVRPTVRRRIRAFYPDLIFSDVGDHLALLIPSTKDGPKEIFEMCRYVRDEIYPLRVRLGIGDPRPSFLMAGESYREACQAIEVMEHFLKDWAIARWDELGAYKLLSTLAQTDGAVTFVDQRLSPLIKYDRAHNTDLVDTLLAIDRGNWNLRVAAESLYIHYNTIKYRFKKICEILSLDPEDSEQRFAIGLSLRIFRISRKPNTPFDSIQ
nr:helix-turn-helix domain-containing protein [uncultured Dethiosulfovibrio sp.]